MLVDVKRHYLEDRLNRIGPELLEALECLKSWQRLKNSKYWSHWWGATAGIAPARCVVVLYREYTFVHLVCTVCV